MSDPILRMINITRDFHDGTKIRRVLNETDLNIYPGELTLIAGPSGSGKTTLLTIMGLILKPTAGKVYINNKDVTTASENMKANLRRENYGFVFQLAELLPALSVFENITVSSCIQGAALKPQLKKRAGELLESFGLQDCLHLQPLQLSGGQKQRVAIVRALMNEPSLLLCDEPTSALDAESSQIVLDTLKNISKDKSRAMVMVTHDPRVFPYADRLLKIENGSVVYDSNEPQRSDAV